MLQVGLFALSDAKLSEGFLSSSSSFAFARNSSFSRRGLRRGGGLLVPLERRTPGLWAPLGRRRTGRRRTPLCCGAPPRVPLWGTLGAWWEFQPLMRAASLPSSVASPGGPSSPRGAYCQTVVSKSTSIQSGYSGGSGGDS